MLPAGTAIGGYRVLRQIGEGGMGTVYLGEHALLGRRAAIKVLLPQLSVNAEIVTRFFNEARAVTQIADPGIVQVFDFGHHVDGSAFIVMELLDGEPLDRRLARVGCIGVAETVRLMRLVCASLAVAHDKGIVHRDLKPENLFIVPDPAVAGGERPKLLDFGIAKLSSDDPGSLKTRTGIVMGTPVYMSPEQCRGAAAVDHRSDIYALGCVMFAMLTGRPPFEGQGSGDLIAMHIREPAPRAPQLPAAVDDILQRCLRKSPADRFPSMTALAHALEAVAAPPTRTATTTLGGATGQTHPELPAAAPRWWRLGLAALAVATAGAVLSLVVPRAEPRPARAAPSAVATLPAALPAAPPDALPAAPPPDAAMPVDAAVVVDAAPLDAPRRRPDPRRPPTRPEPHALSPEDRND